jgi:hypothetical protein
MLKRIFFWLVLHTIGIYRSNNIVLKQPIITTCLVTCDKINTSIIWFF